MTARKHQKARVRARMSHTGERYAAARAHVVRGARPTEASPAPAPADRGTNPAANALRRIVADIGLDLGEPLALIVGGGAGIGVFQFHYAKEDLASLFLAGRYAWDDDLAFIDGALRRLGLEPVITETTSARVADRQLREAIQSGRPVIAWVDAAELGTRGYPAEYRGGAYHVVVVRALDDARGLALLDDLADGPVEVPIETFARARARIAKFRNRLLHLRADARPPADDVVRAAIQAGLEAMHEGFDHPRNRNFSLAALEDWSARLRGTGKDAWPTVFPAGPRLWDGLASIHQYVEHYGNGGGLLRPMIAAGMREAAARVGDPRLVEVAASYDELGARWRDLAVAALPDEVPAFRRTRELQDRRARLYAEGGPDADAHIEALWSETAGIRAAMADDFPLDDAASRSLLVRLAEMVDGLHEREMAALGAVPAAR